MLTTASTASGVFHLFDNVGALCNAGLWHPKKVTTENPSNVFERALAAGPRSCDCKACWREMKRRRARKRRR